MPPSSRRWDEDCRVKMSLMSNVDLCRVFHSLSAFLASEPLSSSHRLASTSTSAAHRINILNFLYQMKHLKFFHIQRWGSLSPSANSPQTLTLSPGNRSRATIDRDPVGR